MSIILIKAALTLSFIVIVLYGTLKFVQKRLNIRSLTNSDLKINSIIYLDNNTKIIMLIARNKTYLILNSTKTNNLLLDVYEN